MNSLNRKEEGVSPVIATILMVAITVVLAATLYMMVGDYGDEPASPVAGDITHRDGTEFEFVALEQPSEAPPKDVEIVVLGNSSGSDFEELHTGDEAAVDWSALSDGDVTDGSRFDIGGFSNINGEENIDEVVVRVEGYDGSIQLEM
ncbi:MAG: archaellin/type IV pilin N-terminal domain-containing protein [Candidatus Thermoplasmatota archaeon]